MSRDGTGVLKGHDYGGDRGMEGTRVCRGHGYGKGQWYREVMGMERDKGMEVTWVWKVQGY